MKQAIPYVILIILVILSYILIKLGVALIISALVFCISLAILLGKIIIKTLDNVNNKRD